MNRLFQVAFSRSVFLLAVGSLENFNVSIGVCARRASHAFHVVGAGSTGSVGQKRRARTQSMIRLCCNYDCGHTPAGGCFTSCIFGLLEFNTWPVVRLSSLTCTLETRCGIQRGKYITEMFSFTYGVWPICSVKHTAYTHPKSLYVLPQLRRRVLHSCDMTFMYDPNFTLHFTKCVLSTGYYPCLGRLFHNCFPNRKLGLGSEFTRFIIHVYAVVVK